MPTVTTYPGVFGPYTPITFTRASTATYFDSAGVLQSAAIDAPRLDYNPSTLAAQGLLIEEARTNLVTRSEEFNDAAWTKTNSSITANATTAPSGTATADKLIEALDTNLVHQVTQSGVTIVSLATYTASVFVKADTRTRVRVGFLVATSGVVADANLTAGTIGAASAFGGGAAAASSIQALNNGWYRISVTGTGAAGTSGELRVELLDASGNRQYNGDGTSGLFLWGAQLEAGAFPTSYIPTTTTALTRSQDRAVINTLAPWYNSAAGTIYAEFAVTQPAAGSNQFLARSSDNSYSNQIGDFINTTGFVGISTASGGVFDGLAATSVVVSANTITKAVGAYATNDLAAVKDGGTVATDPTATIPSGLTRFDLGSDHSGLNNIKAGYLRRITYYPTRLSNAQLQTITT
jgi:hypothetical protein